MKKLFSKLAVFLSISICLCFLYVPCFVITSRASNTSRVVVAHTGTWGNFPFTVPGNIYYTVSDPSGLTVSSYGVPTCYYTNDGETFQKIDGAKIFTSTLNVLVGVIFQASNITNYINDFYTYIFSTKDTDFSTYVKHGLYDDEGNFYGYALNDISGTVYSSVETDPIKVDKYYPDTVKNYYDYYDESQVCQFFTFSSPSKNTFASMASGWDGSWVTNFLNISNTVFNGCYYVNYTCLNESTYDTLSVNSRNHNAFVISGVDYAAAKNTQSFDLFCSRYDLTSSNNRISYTDLISTSPNSTLVQVLYDLYNRQGVVLTSFDKVDLSTNTVTSGTIDSRGVIFGTYRYSNSLLCYFPIAQDLTFYRTTNIKSQMDNHLYQPESFTTDSYYAYQSNNEDSFNFTQTQVDNSITYNGDIYNDAVGDYYNYYDNGYYDSSSNITNVTNITNNYYNSGSDDPDNPNNPDNPDDPSGTLDEILRAILRFFNAIGDIIGTLLASIINLIDSVLEALAGVIENLTGMSDFFSSLFAWIPEPVPQILGAGFGICLVCGIIKFIRG